MSRGEKGRRWEIPEVGITKREMESPKREPIKGEDKGEISSRILKGREKKRKEGGFGDPLSGGGGEKRKIVIETEGGRIEYRTPICLRVWGGVRERDNSHKIAKWSLLQTLKSCLQLERGGRQKKPYYPNHHFPFKGGTENLTL